MTVEYSIERLKEMEYEVKAIIDCRVTSEDKQYLVWWLGYQRSEATWEPRENLTGCERKLRRFERKRARIKYYIVKHKYNTRQKNLP